MKLTQYLDLEGHGAATDLAKKIGGHSSDVSSWSTGTRPVPVKFAVAIETSTNKQVTRQDLRPDDWHLIWPELITPSQATTQEA